MAEGAVGGGGGQALAVVVQLGVVQHLLVTRLERQRLGGHDGGEERGGEGWRKGGVVEW